MTDAIDQDAAEEHARANAVDLARQAAAQAAAAGSDREAAALHRIADRLEANKARRRFTPPGSPGERLRAKTARRGA